MRNKRTKDNQTTLIVKKVAEKWGFSTSYIYMIWSGTRKNEPVMEDLQELHEKIDDVFDNNLLEEVFKVCPFNSKKTTKAK